MSASACTSITSAQTLSQITGVKKQPGSRFKELIDNNSKLKSLEEIPGSVANNFRFPLDLSDDDHWISFRVETERKFRAKDTPLKNTQCFITLPVPTDLQTSYKSGYQNEDLGLIGAALSGNADLTKAEIEQKFDIANLTGALGAEMAQSGQAATLISSLVGNVVAGTPGALLAGGAAAAGTQAFQASMANRGLTRNPHQAVLFQGTGFRSHTFNYKFVAQSEEESSALTDIITAFKFYMAPKLSGSTHFFEYPEQFDIDLKNTEHLFDIGTSVLTDFSVNYHADGEPIYFRGGDLGDAAPFSVSLGMTFQEVTITTKDEIAQRGR